MKVLVATKEQQGDRDGDYCWTVEGELVAVGSLECDDADRCGCSRGFPGLASSRATTTAKVVDRPHISADDLREAVRDWLERDGWCDLLDDDGEVDDLVDSCLADIERAATTFPLDTVVGRHRDTVFVRSPLAA
jgi:hypothetical protein